MQKYVEIEIRKPLYGTFCYIRDKVIKIAIKNKKMLKIKIPQGEGVADPREWRATGKKMSKVFKNPNVPMILYGNHVQVPGIRVDTKKKIKPEEVELVQQGLF